MIWKNIALLTVLCIACTRGFSQETDSLSWLSRTARFLLQEDAPVEQGRFLAYPTIAFAPETSWEIGLSSIYFYHAKRDTTNRLSEATAFTFITTRGQYGFWLDHALYTDRNDWFFFGRGRYQNFPLLYFGIGENTPAEEIALVNATYTLFRERALRKVKESFYTGLEIDYQRLSNVGFEWTDESQPNILPLGAEGTSNLGLGWGLVYDNRHNVLNVRKGFFAELSYINYNFLNANRDNFYSFAIDSRIYRPVRKNQVFAAQVVGQFMGGEIPFNQLALMGGESMMRGYYLGRYRDRNLTAGQVEYRWLPFSFSKRIGAAVFGGMGSVFSNFQETPRFVWAGGAGVRILIFKKKDIFTRFDVAFTEEGRGFYLFLGEAF
ncbi:MAG: BamA/TamA family outer membrane protein [Bacteroidota bacterium]